MKPLRIGVDARLASGVSGGVEQVVIGLAGALSRLDDRDEEYLFLAHPDQDDWIRPHMGGSCTLLHSRLDYPGQPGLGPALRRSVRERWPSLTRGGGLLRSDRTIERAGVEVMHFTTQEAFLTAVPSIYQPHDLLHLHMPELFSPRERARRERVYRAHSGRAALVVAMMPWGKRDLMDRYGLEDGKVAIVPWGSVLGEYPAPTDQDLDELRSKLSLPDSFLLYPAQTWPHKNHERLLEALALLRERDGLAVPLVCPGKQNQFFPRIEERLRELRLDETTRFPGFVSPLELRGLYRLARALVFPSKFEGWGLPVCEAFSDGLAVACSSATSLPDLVGDAGLLFDPDEADEIADRVLRLWTDPELRSTLAGRGRERGREFSFDHAAKLFRAHYRRLAERPLADEDRILLSTQPLT
jgi:glycosyltransferase involved in cell wall biosynthesis